MRITDAGNVGIGTSNPDARLNIANGSSGATPDTNYGDLHVESSASAGITISSATNSVAGIAFGDEDDSFAGGIIYPNFDDSLRFLANGSERMRIDASGNVGIGTISPSDKLDVAGSIRFSGSALMSGNAQYIRAKDSGSATPRILGLNATNDFFVGPIDTYAGGSIFYGSSANVVNQIFDTGGTERMRINASGDVGIGTNTPSTILHVADALPILTLQDDNSSGSSSAGYIQFTDQASARQGYVGMGSASDSELRIVSDNGGVLFDVDGTVKIGTKEVGYNQVDVAVQNANDTTFGVSNGYYYKNGTTSNSVTINSETNFPIGGVLTYANRGTQNTTIVPTSGDVMYWFNGDGAPPQGTRTLAQGGCATVVRVSNGELHITGTGIS
jgi:hypothetical protein